MADTNLIIRQCLTNILERDLSDVVDDCDLTTLGFNSIEFIKFVIDIEMQMNITIKDNDLVNDNFSSIDRISQLLRQYR